MHSPGRCTSTRPNGHTCSTSPTPPAPHAAPAAADPPSRCGPTWPASCNGMTEVPAFVQNGRLDVLAANPLAQALYAPLFADPARPANHARFNFLNPRARDFYPDWERAADDTVAMLRTEAGRDPYDKELTDLVGELSTRSDRLPGPLGRPRCSPAPHRAQAHPPPRRRRTAPVLRGHGATRRPRPGPGRLQRRRRNPRRRRPPVPCQLGRHPRPSRRPANAEPDVIPQALPTCPSRPSTADPTKVKAAPRRATAQRHPLMPPCVRAARP